MGLPELEFHHNKMVAYGTCSEKPGLVKVELYTGGIYICNAANRLTNNGAGYLVEANLGTGKALADQPQYGGRGKDGLRRDANGALTTDPNGEPVRDRYDWFEMKFTGSWN